MSSAWAGPGNRSRPLRLLLAGLVVAGALAPARAGSGVTKVGEFPRSDGGGGVAANGELLIRSSTRRAYQSVMRVGTTITEFDLDTLRPLRSVQLPEFQPAFTTSGETQWLWQLDEGKGRIFTVSRSEGFGEREYHLLSLDLDTLAFRESPSLYATGRRFPVAMSYFAPADRLYLLSRLAVDAFGREAIFLEEREANGALVWEYPLSMCISVRDHLMAPVVARSLLVPSTVYLDCYARNATQSQVVKVVLGADGKPAGEKIFPALPRALSAMFDAGADRIFFLTTNSNAGRGAWVFDGLKEEFLGVIASGDSSAGATDYAMGLDQATGRIYMQTNAGFILADGRRTPLDAGLIFRNLAGPGLLPLHVDSGTHRVFVPDPDSLDEVGRPQRYRILHDEIEVSTDPVPPDVDALTVDVDERPDVTGATYSGEGRAFAARTLTTGGVQRALWNLAIPDMSPEDLAVLWDALEGLPASSGNRDLIFGRAMNASLAGTSSDARAIGASADEGTAADLAQVGLSWPFAEVECHEASGSAGHKETTGATVACDAGSATSSASAAVASLSVPTPVGEVSAEAITAKGSARRDPARGLVSRSVAVARGVSLFGKVRIGEVRAEAEAVAHGRPGTARATYSRAILDAWVDEDGDGTPEFTCAACDPSALLPSINRALAGTASVSMPAPDPAFYPEGSGGGYQAIVRRNVVQSYAARAMNDDDALEVPGLEIVVYSDGRAGRTREVIELAAVLADARYGIYVIPTGSVEPPPPPTEVDVPPIPPPPAVVPTPAVAPPPTRVLGVTATAREILRRVRSGWALAMFHPREAALVGALWAFLLLPLGLVARRRALERLGR